MHSLTISPNSMRFLDKIQFAKCLSKRNTSFLHNNNIIRSLFCSTRIICTDSNPQAAHNPYKARRIPEHNSLSCPVTFLKDIAKISEDPCVKLIPLPGECENHELKDGFRLLSFYNNRVAEVSISKNPRFEPFSAFKKSSEFKDGLPRSLFFYDVRVAESSVMPFSNVYFYSFEDIYDNSVYRVRSRNVPGRVWMSGGSDAKKNDTGRPTEDQLLYVIDRLTQSLLGFFERPHDFSIYHKNIVFQNNIKGVIVKGLRAYGQTMYLLKFYGYVQYARVKVEILKITHHVEDGTVRVRWRVKGVSRHKVLLNLWKLKSMTWQQFAHEEAEWLDGFSVFNVGTDGLIFKHVCDKMTPDDSTAATKKADLKSRLLGLFDMNPRGPAAGSLNTLIPCQEYANKKLT